MSILDCYKNKQDEFTNNTKSYNLKKRVKWYCADSYLELYDVKADKIVSIEYNGIEKIWNHLITREVVICDGASKEIYSQLFTYLVENDYLELN